MLIRIALILFSLNAHAEINEMLDKAKQNLMNFEVKQYDHPELNSLNTGSLEQEGIRVREAEIVKNPNGGISTIEEASSYKRVADKVNYDQLDLFKRADKIMYDPVALFNSLNSEICREINTDKDRHYTKREIFETKTEIVELLKTCEVPITSFSCEKSLKLTCIAHSDCDYGGIIKESVASDMSLTYANNILTIGTIADNYWKGECQIYDRDTTFILKNVHLLNEFRIIQAGFDDYIEIKINGITMYVGPDGGSSLSVQESRMGTQVYNGINLNSCERNTNWNNNLNIDLKPYLIEGRNRISIRVIVTGQGEGWLKISAKQYCCSSWQEEWIKNCDQKF